MEASKENPGASPPSTDPNLNQESEAEAKNRIWRLMDLLRTQNRTNYRQILPRPTEFEIKQRRVEDESQIEEQSRVEGQRWLEAQKQMDDQRRVEYQRWVEYQERVEDQKHRIVQNAATLESRNIMQPNHIKSFPTLLSWDTCQRYAPTNAAALEARDVLQPDPDGSSNQPSWNANHGYVPMPTDADLNKPVSSPMDSLAEDQARHIADHAAVSEETDVIRSIPDSRSIYPSPPKGDAVHDIQASPYFGDASSRASRPEGFTTMEDLLKYERQHYQSIRYFRQPVRNPATGRWTMLQTPMVQGRPLAVTAADDVEIPGLGEGVDMPLEPFRGGLARSS